jgi:hypothetical protein
MNDPGILQGASGSVIVRWTGCMLITHTGIPDEEILPCDIVNTDFQNNAVLAMGNRWAC